MLIKAKIYITIFQKFWSIANNITIVQEKNNGPYDNFQSNGTSNKNMFFQFKLSCNAMNQLYR